MIRVLQRRSDVALFNPVAMASLCYCLSLLFSGLKGKVAREGMRVVFQLRQADSNTQLTSLATYRRL